MTRADFCRLLRPFVTAVGDAHTWLRNAYDDSSGSSFGIFLYFGVVAADHEFRLLHNLAYSGILWERPFLADRLPEWRDKSQGKLVLRHKDVREAEHAIPVPSRLPDAFINPGSRVDHPRPGAEGFVYKFLNPARTTALLVVDDMGSYREAFEMRSTSNPREAEHSARELYQRLHEGNAPIIR